jgi:hypothetical protein
MANRPDDKADNSDRFALRSPNFDRRFRSPFPMSKPLPSPNPDRRPSASASASASAIGQT